MSNGAWGGQTPDMRHNRPLPLHALDGRAPVPHDELQAAFHTLLVHAEHGDANRDGLLETPQRAAQAWHERTAGYALDPASVFKTFDGEGYDEMVALGPVPFYSTCEHHLEDFVGSVWVAYIAAGRIIGLSKLARLVDVYAKRLQVQERLTMQIADAMETHLAPKGIAVLVSGRHMCIERRGCQKPGVEARTSVMRGACKDDPKARDEALQLMRA